MGSGYNSDLIGVNSCGTSAEFHCISPMESIYFQKSIWSSGIIKGKGVMVVSFVRKNKELASRLLMFSAVISVMFSFLGWVGADIWLASTQWLLVAAVLALFSIYLKQ